MSDCGGVYDQPIEVCAGCTHYRIWESHYTFCTAQPVASGRLYPPSDYGKQTLNAGHPDKGCPFSKNAKKRKRTFSNIVCALGEKQRGWEEQFPDPNRWYFKKNGWLATVYWESHRVTFQRLKPG